MESYSWAMGQPGIFSQTWWIIVSRFTATGCLKQLRRLFSSSQGCGEMKNEVEAELPAD
jgi:hypothetical protein